MSPAVRTSRRSLDPSGVLGILGILRRTSSRRMSTSTTTVPSIVHSFARRFRGPKGDEVDYVIEWDPVPCRFSGDFQVVVRVGGQPMGTWPLKVVEIAANKAAQPKT